MTGSNPSPLLKTGVQAPDFTLENQRGEPVHLYDVLDRHWVVLFFYPKDHSPVCTTEVCAFRDSYDDFQGTGAEVLGISSDPIAAHAAFAAKHQLPYQLLADPDGRVRTAYGVPKTLGLLPGRTTFVIDSSRIIRLAYSSSFNANAHKEKALQLLREQP
jgi:peroxiredoxin Q/BCP